jgi:hypothetical protein
MKQLLIFLLSLCTAASATAQKAPDGGGGHTPPKSECVSPVQRQAIERMLDSNRQQLIKQGILPEKKSIAAAKTTSAMFSWPLHQVSGGYAACYGISNYVDHDTTYPSHVLDWNCGARTYDLSSGYNHGGMDIFLWPFYWNMMEAAQVEILAAAPGVIIGKTDGYYDHNCAMGSPDWNAVYIQHSDGTEAWYGHMKKGSVTTSAVGTSVLTGDHLGFVGSSGSSTGPHLHFELHDAAGEVRDPYAGLCQLMPTLWNTPKPYYESQVNTLMTHFAPPVFNTCPNPDSINARDTFAPGSTVYFAAYYHDQLAGQSSTYTIYRTDNSVYQTWTGASTTAHYAASYWYWSYTIPATQPTGNWKFKVTFEGNTNTHNFYILAPVSHTGVNDVQLTSIVYPNPAKNEIVVSDQQYNAASRTFVLTDLAGRTVLNQKLTVGAAQEVIDIKNISKGFYLFRLLQDDKTVSQGKIVKE